MTLALLTAALLAQADYTPQEAQALFTQANDAFYKQPPDYQAAKAAYLKLIEHGQGGQDVLFNLGTACLAAGDLGQAVLYLERARRLGRTDDIEANLAIARTRQADQVVGENSSEPFLQRIADASDQRTVTITFLVALWLGFGFFLVRRVLPGSTRGWASLLGGVSLLLALGSGAVVAVHAWVDQSIVEAIVMPATAQVREFPGATAKVAFEVHAGLKVRVMEESGKFVHVRLPNNLEGWTEREGVVEL